MTSSETPALCPTPTGEQIERVLSHWTTRCSRPVLRCCLRLYHRAVHIGWTASGREHLPAVGTPFILAANHQSHLDTAAVLATLPPDAGRRLVVAAAADTFAPRRAGFWNDPARATLAWLLATGFGAFPFDRGAGARRSLRAAAHLVGRGHPLLVYPEGTRSRTGEIAPFKPGVAWLAAQTGAAVVPVHLHGAGSLLPCEARRPAPGRFHVSYGVRVPPRREESHAAFAARVESAVRLLGAAHEGPAGPPATGISGPGRPRFAEIGVPRRPAGRRPVSR